MVTWARVKSEIRMKRGYFFCERLRERSEGSNVLIMGGKGPKMRFPSFNVGAREGKYQFGTLFQTASFEIMLCFVCCIILCYVS